MARTQRLREETLKLLRKRSTASTVDIFEHLNDRFRWGASMNQVSNIMARDKRFLKVGTARGFHRGKHNEYTVFVWALKEDVEQGKELKFHNHTRLIDGIET